MSDNQPGQVIDGNPIINDAFAEPTRHWHFGGVVPRVIDGRRRAGYLAPSPNGQLRITDELIELTVVNDLRNRVRTWREEGYPGVTLVTRDLFRHWFDDERKLLNTRPFFCQQEAMETIVFLVEAPSDRKVGINVPASGEAYTRWAVKMATGTGKTTVMALLVAWSGLNKIASRQDSRFTDQVLVVAPNLTVRDRLAGSGGVDPKNPESLYVGFDLVPPQYSGLIGQVKVQVMNWHQLAPKEDARRSVVQRGRESDAAFCRRVLTDLSSKGRILVLNDEAHHAYRLPPNTTATGSEEEVQEATVWISGLERVHRHREIVRAVDCSATPMYPSLFKDRAWTPFEWIVSDFALVDAIEAGLVKIPRTPTDDNTGEAIPKYRNLWEHIKETLPKRSEVEDQSHPLTDYLAEADGPLKQLAGAWEESFETWRKAGRQVPPVMIAICHDTTVARMLERHIAQLGEASPLLVNPKDGPAVTVRIDSDALAKAEAGEGNASAEETRELVATVGKPGKPGEQIRCLVSVAMLSEGWDARNVTHILGLRAFSSQLLCEQVVGRGLRRSDYTGDLSQPEYVDVYGVPFQLLPMAKATGAAPSAPPDYTIVHTVRDRADKLIKFPRIVQVVPDITDTLAVDLEAIEPIRVTPAFDPTDTYVEFDLGTPHAGMGGTTQNRESAYERFRIQRLVYKVAAGLIEPYGKPWLFPQALEVAQQVLRPVAEGGKIQYATDVDPREICNLRYLTVIRERIGAALRPGEGPEKFLPALDEYQPIGSTDGLNYSSPTDKCVQTTKSHLSHAVVDSGLERKICAVLDASETVDAWVKNHRLFLEIPYLYFGNTYRYRPDFVVRLTSGLMVLVEGKSEADEKDDAKATAARRWAEAVNTWGELGTWAHHICYDANNLGSTLRSLDLEHAGQLTII